MTAEGSGAIHVSLSGKPTSDRCSRTALMKALAGVELRPIDKPTPRDLPVQVATGAIAEFLVMEGIRRQRFELAI